MALERLDIDWGYILERLENLLDLGEEFLNRQLAEFEPDPAAFSKFIAFRWLADTNGGLLEEIATPDLPEAEDLKGVDVALATLQQNTRQFVRGHSANHALLWGERGSGKSSLVKCMLRQFAKEGLRMVEVHQEDLYQLNQITRTLRPLPYRFVLFCDGLNFNEDETVYRELKGLLEGGLEAHPDNVLLYATSNRRHMMPQRPAEKTREIETHPEEAISERLGLAERFGISLGFFPMDETTFLEIVTHLARRRGLNISNSELRKEALTWASQRGSLSGRVARQFCDALTGRLALEEENRKRAHPDPAD